MNDATLDERPARSRATETHIDVIRRLQAKIDDVTRPFVAQLQETPFSLLDFPDYPNVGDSAIWAGQLAWLRRSVQSAPTYTCDHRTEVSTLERDLADGPILLSGGGNFGDLWETLQGFRENVYSHFGRHRPIMQLPQSIHFDRPESVESARSAVARARQLTLLVRDLPSFEFANANFDCTVALCPDMAFALGPLERIGAPQIDVLLLLRGDKEGIDSSRMTQALPPGWSIEDWLDDDRLIYPRTKLTSVLRAVAQLRVRGGDRFVRRHYRQESLIANRMKRGLSQLSRARYIITDRLHVHILSTLMGIPHCFLDNSYGKISRFSAAFSTKWTGCSSAQNLNEAVGIAHDWLAAHGAAR
ncbi:MAG: exopolysaccharide biosynthesis protein [Hyphomicrobiales bacterium]|nr:MAG: exopolysaccharide biosynthesis protein [Hyphomicrobiales bacterium]